MKLRRSTAKIGYCESWRSSREIVITVKKTNRSTVIFTLHIFLHPNDANCWKAFILTLYIDLNFHVLRWSHGPSEWRHFGQFQCETSTPPFMVSLIIMIHNSIDRYTSIFNHWLFILQCSLIWSKSLSLLTWFWEVVNGSDWNIFHFDLPVTP